jgi:hypothetical protein
LSEKRNVAEGERVSDRLAGETEIGQGYPEEQPGSGGGESEDKPPREGAKAPRKHDDQVDDSDHGKATGNPRSAG